MTGTFRLYYPHTQSHRIITRNIFVRCGLQRNVNVNALTYFRHRAPIIDRDRDYTLTITDTIQTTKCSEIGSPISVSE